jgi:1-aminocyclopropane-1-carboxylate deaminase/D-cysteine desulfhydrase-like pyridoxal-dependent ACC family enzyme
MFETQASTPLPNLTTSLLVEKELKLYVKRDDLIHPTISGNKWRKLKYNLLKAREAGYTQLLTFGGAYSNHIAATAAAAKAYGFHSIGIIRGEELNESSNKTLTQATENGMDLQFISREKYRQKEQEDFINSLGKEYGDFYLIPEGGSNTLAVKGCTEIVSEIDIDFDCIISAVGTGGTLSGIACGLHEHQKAVGISALKGANYLDDEVKYLIQAYSGNELNNWQINHEYHLGGYAKVNDDLLHFIEKFKREHEIQLDQVYTGKMMKALFDLIEKDYFKKGSTIIALHTGGLQGISEL